MVVEDLHWADPSTLDLIEVLIAQTPTVPMLLVLTCRPEFQLPWAMRSYMAHVTLTRLSREHMAAMVIHLLGGKDVPDVLLDHLIRQTDGGPLFLEELQRRRSRPISSSRPTRTSKPPDNMPPCSSVSRSREPTTA